MWQTKFEAIYKGIAASFLSLGFQIELQNLFADFILGFS